MNNCLINVKSLKKGSLLTYRFFYQSEKYNCILLGITKDYNFHYILRVLQEDSEELIPIGQIEILDVKESSNK